MKRPDFFIVGAPKCGTTAMYTFLRQHPQIFMPFLKEPLYFGSDLTTRYGRMLERDYLSLFEDARADQQAGEASAWYLYSRTAAAEIRAFNPEARIIIMLRNPVEMMYSQHSQLLYNQQESLLDFAAALAAEPDRRAGRALPRGPVRPENLFYRDAARFAGQVERYFAVFGREGVHVIIHDDLRLDAPRIYQETLRFLGVDTYQPTLDVVNENKRVRNTLLQRAIFAPPAPVRKLIPIVRRYRIAHSVRAALLRLNSQARRRTPMDPDLRRTLEVEFLPEVERLEEVIGRDLSAWKPA